MKQFYNIVILIFCLQFGFGQIAFQTNPVYTSGQYLSSYNNLTVGDLDADGDLDIVVTTYGGNEVIAWFENIDGLGTYAPSVIIANNDDETVATIADLNGDGYNDIITSYNWYQNLGSQGGFSDAIPFSSNYSGSIQTTDFDNDGDLDVLAARTWYENTDGLGTLVLKQTFFTNSGNDFFDRSVSGDMDNDGDMDIISIRYSSAGNVSWYENTDGLGSFETSQIISSLDEPKYLSVGNLDNDNDLDVVTFSRGSGRLNIHKNINLGLSWNTTNIYTNNADNSRSMNIGDIDFDGDLDISLAFDSRNFLWFRNTGSGNFQQRNTSTNADNFAVNADVDGDNDLDVVIINDCTGTIAWDAYPYTTTSPDRTYIETSLGSLEDVFFIDMDMDGDLDVMSYSDRNCSGSNADLFAWYENKDGYIAKVPLQWSINTTKLKDIKIVDIDNDADMDILGFSDFNNRIFVYTNDGGGGNFNYAGAILNINYSSSSYVDAYELADLDSDGDKDLITFIGQNTVWLENIDNQFNTETVVTNTPYNSVVAADLDNDGDNDLLYSNFNSLRWIENIDGNGTFGNESTLGAIQTSNKILKAVDLDNDSDLDIVCYDLDSNAIVWLENIDSLGTFSLPQNIVTNVPSPTTLIVDDVNNDGAMDIICSYDLGLNWTDNVVWYENLGGQNFSEKQLIAQDESKKIEIGDFDNDGDLDILSAAENGVLLYKNVGDLGNEILGSVNYDEASNNCTTTGVPLSNVLVVSDNGIDSFGSFTLDDGSFSNNVNLGMFSTSLISDLPGYFTVSPSESPSDFPSLGNTDTVNFCIQPTGTFNDLNISVYPSISDPRPGFITSYQLVYSNIGTTQISGSVSFEFDDSKLNFLNASEMVTSQTANLLTFDFSDLNPFETRTINLEFNVFPPPTTNIDDELVSIAVINPVSGDETEEDNIFILEQTVIGSYDPNDITVLEGDEIFIEDAGKYLHYIIRFQNTGTASAINVRVENVLDNKLDWTTMQLESLSHSGRVEITNETDVSFIFNSIYLPDSTNDEPNSHGYIAYKIKPKNDVEVGDLVSGTADIFFDFNPPIITNTVNTEIVAPLSVNDFDLDSIKLYPNPATEKLEITSNQIIDRLTIIDINGRELTSIDISSVDYSLDVSNLAKGVYFLKIQLGESKSTKKFIKN